MRGTYNEIINRVSRGLLKCNAHNDTAVSKFSGAISGEHQGQVFDGHLPLE